MQLDFDRLYVGDQVIPLDAKVVDVKGYKIDSQGRILGKGHAVRDTVLWMIPVLWPIDLINLPRRGPRPTLKAETALTLRVMEDIQVPVVPEPQRDPYGLSQRPPDAYAPQPPAPTQEPDEGPEQSYVQPYAQPDQQWLRRRWRMRRRLQHSTMLPRLWRRITHSLRWRLTAMATVTADSQWACGREGMRTATEGTRVDPVVSPYGYRGYAPGVRSYGYGYAGRPGVSGMRAGVGGRPMMAMRGGGGYGRR